MERSGFFTSIDNDRIYNADFFTYYLNDLISNGIATPDALKVELSEENRMNIIIKPGKAWINGFMYENTEPLKLKVSYGNGVLSRVDLVVLRLHKEDRNIKCYIKKGVEAQDTLPYALTRNEEIYEICLALINIDRETVELDHSNIVDTRLDSELCGIVKGSVENIAIDTIFNKLESYIDLKENEIIEWVKSNSSKWEYDFNKFREFLIDNLPNQVINTVLVKIEELEKTISSLALTDENISTSIENYINVKEALIGVISKSEQVRKSIIESLNTKTTIANIPTDSDWNIIKQSLVNIIEPKGNAAASDVLIGKTFTTNSGIEYIGTMPNRGGAQTITPGTSDKILNSGYYSGNITIKGDSNLIPANIKKSINIFGVVGTKAQGKKFATGYSTSKTVGSFAKLEVSVNLGFTPTYIFAKRDDADDGNWGFVFKKSSSEALTLYSSGSSELSISYDVVKNTLTESKYYQIISNTAFNIKVNEYSSSVPVGTKFKWYAFE